MRIFLILSLLFAFMSCKELGEAIQKYDEPVIDDLILSQNIVTPGDTVVATVIATNPEKGVLTYEWEKPDGGQFIPPIDEETVRWVAPFEGDDYRIRAVVRNDEKATLTKSVTVQSLDKPLVILNSPGNNDYFVQGQEIEIKATAYHDNNLNKVWLLVDDIYVDSLDWNSSDDYEFIFTAGFSLVGEVEIKVLAEVFNQPGNTSSDYITVNIEGILPKAENP